MSVSDVAAQSSFANVFGQYTAEGRTVVQTLQNNLSSAIELIANSATWLDIRTVSTATDDFTAALVNIISPMITSGTNVLHTNVISDLATNATYGHDPKHQELNFERIRDAEVYKASRDEEDLIRIFSSGGFTAPTGAANAMLGRLQEETRNRIFLAGREFAGKKVDTYMEDKKASLAAALGIEKDNVATFVADMNRLVKVLNLKMEQFKAQVHTEVALAAAAMSGLNVNVGLSVAGNADLRGAESESETFDLDAGLVRQSQSTHINYSDGTAVSTSYNYSTNEATNFSTSHSTSESSGRSTSIEHDYQEDL